eukprot:7271080-Prymnesium_polylepis.1
MPPDPVEERSARHTRSTMLIPPHTMKNGAPGRGVQPTCNHQVNRAPPPDRAAIRVAQGGACKVGVDRASMIA